MYTEGPDGVMRNQSGQVLSSALQRRSDMSQSSDLSAQATQPVINFAPYSHRETKEPKWKAISGSVQLGRAYELDKLNEAAFNLLGIRAGAYTMEAGVYANSYTWNPSYRVADYWGVFANFATPKGQITFDYGILGKPVGNYPVILFQPARVTSSANWPYAQVGMALGIDAPKKCDPKWPSSCGYPKGTNTGYLSFVIMGRPKYPRDPSPSFGQEWLGGWRYRFIYDTSNVGFGPTFQGNFVPDGSNKVDFSMSGVGWNFYRETTLLSLDKASLDDNRWTGTGTGLLLATAKGQMHTENRNYTPLYSGTMSNSVAWNGKAPGIEQPNVTCPVSQGASSTVPSTVRYVDKYSQRVAGLKDGKQRLVTIECTRDYYGFDQTKITVGD